MLRQKKGQIMDNLGALGIGIAALGITLVVVFLILSQTAANTTVAADGNATAALTTLTNAADQIPGWVPLIVIAVIGALLLSLVALFRKR
jgi:Sec-independent protein translocase protein TatA